MAEGVGFEPTVALRLRLISSQVPLTTQPPFRYINYNLQSNSRLANKPLERQVVDESRVKVSGLLQRGKIFYAQFAYEQHEKGSKELQKDRRTKQHFSGAFSLLIWPATFRIARTSLY
jgi:hypothetical protein